KQVDEYLNDWYERKKQEEEICPHYDHKKEVLKLNNRYNKQVEDITF
ncbi:4324_t:CDS:1, partial [Racocetra persica]